MDRISDLPLPIIHLILSRLSGKELFLTSLLSKHWSSVQASFPIFDFDHTDFLGGMDNICERVRCHLVPLQKLRDSTENLSKFVDDSLLRFSEAKSQHMQKFKLTIGIIDSKFEWASHLLDKWIQFAVEHRVREFDLRIGTTENKIYIMPDALFLAKFVTTLSLYGCKLAIPCSSFSFTLLSLKVVYLDNVYISAEMMEKLISDSPVLEEFRVWDSWGFNHCHVPKHRRLIDFEISLPREGLENIEIAAQNLCSFKLVGANLTRPSMINMTECQHLKVLKLFAIIMITELDFHHLISYFPWLEDLSVEDCRSLKRINISSQRLRKLKLMYSCESITIDAPNLQSFSYSCTNIPTFYSIVAPCPWKVDLHYRYGENEYMDIDNFWYLSLKKFLGAASKIECLYFGIHPFKVSFNLEEFIQSSPSPPIQVQELKLGIQMQDINFMDGLLTVCRPKTISLYSSHRDPNVTNFNLWLYGYLAKREMNISNGRCWQYSLKDIKIDNFYNNLSLACDLCKFPSHLRC